MAKERGATARLIGTLLLVASMIAVGIVIGARLWPRVVTIEQRAAMPVREVRGRSGFSAALPDLVENACPAIVELLTPPASPPPRKGKGRDAPPPLPREAFFVSAQGYLLTAADGLPAEGLKVRLDDGRVLNAQLRSIAPASGLALLKVEGTDYPAFLFATADYPRPGTAGFVPLVPPGQGCQAQAATVSSDFVAERAKARAYVRIRPMVEPGVAGAPFVDELGQVAGVAVPDPDDVGGLIYLPGHVAAPIVDELLRGEGTVTRPFGLIATDLPTGLARRLGSDRRGGAVIVVVVPGAAGARAGLQAGDVVLSAAGAPVAGALELSRTLSGASAAVSMEVARGGTTRTVELVATAG